MVPDPRLDCGLAEQVATLGAAPVASALVVVALEQWVLLVEPAVFVVVLMSVARWVVLFAALAAAMRGRALALQWSLAQLVGPGRLATVQTETLCLVGGWYWAAALLVPADSVPWCRGTFPVLYPLYLVLLAAPAADF